MPFKLHSSGATLIANGETLKRETKGGTDATRGIAKLPFCNAFGLRLTPKASRHYVITSLRHYVITSLRFPASRKHKNNAITMILQTACSFIIT